MSDFPCCEPVTVADGVAQPKAQRVIICGEGLREETRAYWAKRDAARLWLNACYRAYGFPELVRPLPSEEFRRV